MPKEMKAAVRVNALTLGGSGSKSLPGMEDHGKRLDAISKHRSVSRRRPLVYQTLDLRTAYEHHVDGAKMNAAATKPVLHMIVQYPDMSGPDAPAPFRDAKTTRARQKIMLDQALRFANETHGGNAVFAGRVDRDEKGQWTVDLFLAPRYEKITKTGKSSGEWVSATKFGKALAEKHQDYIKSRHKDAQGKLTGPRHVGIALQAEFREFFERENGIALVFAEKDHFEPDRLEPEAFAAAKIKGEAVEAEARAEEAARLAAEAEAARVAAEEEASVAMRRKLDAEAEAERLRQRAEADRSASLAANEAKADAEAEAQAIRRSAAAEARRRASAFEALAKEIERGTFTKDATGKIRVQNVEALKQGLPEIRPALLAAGASYDVQQARRAVLDDREADMARREADIVAREAELTVRERQIDDDLREIRGHREWLRSARDTMAGYLERIAGWLRRPDLPAAAQDAARDLIGEGDDIQREMIVRESALTRYLQMMRDRSAPDIEGSAAEESHEEAGPGF